MVKRKPKKIIYAAIGAAAGFMMLLLFLAGKHTVAVLEPKGSIANEQRELIIIASLLMLIVVLPVFILTAYISWKYREGNKRARYMPEWDHSRTLETIWWSVPFAVIVVLSGIIWNSSHQLDPSKEIHSAKKALEVQVVALEWKWLFIYPEQRIATINELHLPEDRPINFSITADAPMNSFWIPQLGGQIYAMTGMETKLHLIADEQGMYKGQSANLSGEGFSGMVFDTHVISESAFAQWTSDKRNLQPLDSSSYQQLAEASKNVEPAFYRLNDETLFDDIVSSFGNHTAPKKSGGAH